MMTKEQLIKEYINWIRGVGWTNNPTTTFTNFLKSPWYNRYNISNQQLKNFMSELKFEAENLPPNLPELSKNEQATRIQSHFRKFLARKKFTKSKEAVVKLQEGTREFLKRKQQSKAKSMQAVNLIMAANWTPYMKQRALELIRSKSAQPSVKTHAALVNRLGKNATNNNRRYLKERQKNAAFQGILGNSLEPNIKAALQSGTNLNLPKNNPVYLKTLSNQLAAVIKHASNKQVNAKSVQNLKIKVDELLKNHERELEKQKQAERNASLAKNREKAIKNVAEKAFRVLPNEYGLGRFTLNMIPAPYKSDKNFGPSVTKEILSMDAKVKNQWESEVNAYFRNKHKTQIEKQTMKKFYKGGPKPEMTEVVEKLTPSSGYGQKKR